MFSFLLKNTQFFATQSSLGICGNGGKDICDDCQNQKSDLPLHKGLVLEYREQFGLKLANQTEVMTV